MCVKERQRGCLIERECVGVGVRVRGREREGKRDRWKESDREIGREEDVAIILLNYFELSLYTCCF